MSETVPKFWREQGSIVTNERTLAALGPITELIDRSRRARTIGEHNDLQRDLAGFAIEIRDFHKQVSAQKDELRGELRQAKGRGDMARVQQISVMLPELDLALRANRRCWGALRAVQDGVIWRAFSFDRHRIGMLGHGDSVHWPSASFESEIVAAEVHWEAGRVALFCDLSSCVNTGDLIVFHNDEPKTELIEVKENEDASDETPQFERMRHKAEFLNTGYSEKLSPYPLHSPARRPRLRTNLSALGDALRYAARHGFCIRLAGGVAQLNVFDATGVAPADADAHADTIERLHRRFQARIGIEWRDAETYAWDSMTRVDRDQSHAVSTTAPYSIFPFRPDVCARLLLGLAGYRATVNLSVLWAALERAGWERAAVPDELAGSFLAVRKGTILVVPPNNLMEQLVTELLTPAAFAASLDATAELLKAERSKAANVGWANAMNVGWAWEGEDRVWS